MEGDMDTSLLAQFSSLKLNDSITGQDQISPDPVDIGNGDEAEHNNKIQDTLKSPKSPSLELDSMASPTDSENSYYTARESGPTSVSPMSPPANQSPNFNHSPNMSRPFTAVNSDLFTFAVPMVPANALNKVPSKSQSGGSNSDVGLNIFASPPIPGGSYSEDEFIPASSLADTVNANDWDTLLDARTSSGIVPRTANRWDRDSLYQKFDPLVKDSPVASTQYRQCFQSPEHRMKLPTASDDQFPEGQTEGHGNLFNLGDTVVLSTESDVMIMADEEDDPEDTLVSSTQDFPERRRQSSGSDPANVNTSSSSLNISSRRESHDNNVVSARAKRPSHGGTSLHSVDIDEARLETALAQQELNFKAELAERDERIQELEARLTQMSCNQNNKSQEETKHSELAQALHKIDEFKAALRSVEIEKRLMKNQVYQLKQDLQNAQNVCLDINMKYEEVKVHLENSRQNEELLLQRDVAMIAKVAECDAQVEEIKEAVKNKLDNMYQNYEAKCKNVEGNESGTLRTQLRRAEMKIEGLENEVAQKTSELQKLSTLCDELILQNINEGR